MTKASSLITTLLNESPTPPSEEWTQRVLTTVINLHNGVDGEKTVVGGAEIRYKGTSDSLMRFTSGLELAIMQYCKSHGAGVTALSN